MFTVTHLSRPRAHVAVALHPILLFCIIFLFVGWSPRFRPPPFYVSPSPLSLFFFSSNFDFAICHYNKSGRRFYSAECFASCHFLCQWLTLPPPLHSPPQPAPLSLALFPVLVPPFLCYVSGGLSLFPFTPTTPTFSSPLHAGDVGRFYRVPRTGLTRLPSLHLLLHSFRDLLVPGFPVVSCFFFLNL